MNEAEFDKSFVRSNSVINLLNNIPMFDKLTHKEIKNLAIQMKARRCEPGKVLFNEGETGDYVIFVVSGTLEVLKTSKTSDDIFITSIGKGRTIGEMAVIDDFPRSATIRAKTQSILLILTRDHFDHILYEFPSIGIKVLKGIARQISLNLRKTSSRLAEYMLPL
ncbi:cyclic nucleotide-binding domain-containing protein [Candidatus Latescibacterota bacterium]